MLRPCSLALPFFLLAGCISSGAGRAPELVSSVPAVRAPSSSAAAAQDPFSSERRSSPVWQAGQPLMHGFLGATFFQDVTVDGGSGARIDGDSGDLDELPLIGGGAQWKLGGDRIDFGLEGLLSFAWRSNAEAFVIGGGGAAVAIDVNLLLFELYGGPFASVFLGERWRIYGAAGPLMQFADYDQTGNGLADDGSGFGTGLYARTGLEYALPSRTLIGFGARWSDSSVDLGGSLGDLEIDGLQAVFTVTTGL